MDVLKGAPQAPPLERIDVAQPALFAMMVSLAGLWSACGVRPGAVVGHSQGEIAAVHVAGGLSLEDSARLVARRSQVLASIAGRGQMASIALAAQEVAEQCGRWGERIVVAAINGPSSTVVSGEPEAVRELLSQCEQDGVRARGITGALGAGHSPQMEPLREQLVQACSPIAPRSSETAFYSTVTAQRFDSAAVDPDYWYRNTREPVRFDQTIRRLLDDGFRTFVEISPHPVLSFAVNETIDDTPIDRGRARVVGSLRRGDGGPRRFQMSLAEAWVQDVPVDWKLVYKGSGASRAALPTYAFQRRRYWIEQASSTAGIRIPAQRAPEGASGSLIERLAGVTAAERRHVALAFLCGEIAAVLGHASAEAVDADRAFKEARVRLIARG